MPSDISTTNPSLEQLRSIWAWIAQIEDQKVRDFAKAYQYHRQLTGSQEPDWRKFDLDPCIAFEVKIQINKMWRDAEETNFKAELAQLWKEIQPALSPWFWGLAIIILGGIVGWLVTLL